MKFLACLFLLTTTLASCHKILSGKCGDEQSQLTGKWKYVEQYISIGGPGTWYPAEPAGQVIEFKNDGIFKGSGSFQNESNHYELLDKERVKITPAKNEAGYVIMGYTFSNSNNELQLFPLEPSRCIEGCAGKFVRD